MRHVTLKDFFQSVSYKINDSSEYMWECYGKNAFSLDMDKKRGKEFAFSTGIIFDTKTSKVYQMDSWDYKKRIIYRWINPSYVKKYLKESKKRGIDPFKNEEQFKIMDVSATKILRETKIAMSK
jgi:hypothetical protein